MKGHYNAIRNKGQLFKREQLNLIWSFKQKQQPVETLLKYKARLCCHGEQQQWGLNYWETYAPVVSWSLIRIALILEMTYPQAHIKTDIFLHTPQGIKLDRDLQKCILKLIQNLYNLKKTG